MSALSSTSEAGRVQRPAAVRVWDPFVRIFHWSLVTAFTVAWLAGDELKRVHVAAGYVILGLVAFRLVWGVAGSAHARFTDFIYRPKTVAGFLKDTLHLRAKRYIGHNPAGGVMVIALLAMLIVTCATGIMMTTTAFWGVSWVEEAHEIAVNLMLALIGLHLVGVFAASFEHRENLVRAMITGRKRSQ